MKLIDALTADPNQSLQLVLDDGKKVQMTIQYLENQQGWFYSLTYGADFSVVNRRLVAGPNILRQFKNVIPFGLACVVADGLEPVFIDDFTNGRASIYLLNASEVFTAEVVISGFRNG